MLKKNLEEDFFILISDLNLTMKESQDLDLIINKLNHNGTHIKLQLLDHHASGAKSSERFDWYFLDDKRCASKIVYDYIVEEFEGFSESQNRWLEPLVNVINAIDIWLDHDVQNFEFGKVCLGLIHKATEIKSKFVS